MKVLKKIIDIIVHFFRRLSYFIPYTIGAIICLIIKLVTYEPNTTRRVTVRKAKRIRRLTKFKLYVWKYFPWYFKFIHDDYFENLNNKFGFLIEK